MRILKKAQENSATIESIRQKTEEIKKSVFQEVPKEESKNI
jgi:hypothetical protein